MTLQEKASVILARAYQEALITPVPACSYSSFLDFVLDNNHLPMTPLIHSASRSVLRSPVHMTPVRFVIKSSFLLKLRLLKRLLVVLTNLF